MRGRKPIQNATSELMSNPGKRPLNSHEPKPGELYAAPGWMRAAQPEGWAYAITNAPAGLLNLLDRSVLAICVVAEDIHREAAESVAQYGLLTKSAQCGATTAIALSRYPQQAGADHAQGGSRAPLLAVQLQPGASGARSTGWPVRRWLGTCQIEVELATSRYV